MIQNFRFIGIKITEESQVLGELEKIDFFLKNNQNFSLNGDSICFFGTEPEKVFVGREVTGVDSSLDDEDVLVRKDFYEMESMQSSSISIQETFSSLIKNLKEALEKGPGFDLFILRTLTLDQSELSFFKRVK